ncbi:hypothetical protein BDW66DRAFT_4862 [Aspergillus desertorum]
MDRQRVVTSVETRKWSPISGAPEENAPAHQVVTTLSMLTKQVMYHLRQNPQHRGLPRPPGPKVMRKGSASPGLLRARTRASSSDTRSGVSGEASSCLTPISRSSDMSWPSIGRREARRRRRGGGRGGGRGGRRGGRGGRRGGRGGRRGGRGGRRGRRGSKGQSPSDEGSRQNIKQRQDA